MDSDAGVDGGEIGRGGGFSYGLRNLKGAVHLVGAVADADGEDFAYTRGVGSGKNLREVFGRVHIEMGVRVDEVHGFPVVARFLLSQGGTPLPLLS
jgi:hypothetical protein